MLGRSPARTEAPYCSTRSTWSEIEDRDHPLVMRYQPEEGWLKPLALPPASPRLQQTLAQIAAIAIDKSRHRHAWISYSRRAEHYSRRGCRYDEWPDLYRFSTIPRAVDMFAAAGYLEAIKAPPNPECGWQSKFRATPALIEALGNEDALMVLLTHFRPERPLTADEEAAIGAFKAIVEDIAAVKAKHRSVAGAFMRARPATPRPSGRPANSGCAPRAGAARRTARSRVS
jgi:hypothetical protein